MNDKENNNSTSPSPDEAPPKHKFRYTKPPPGARLERQSKSVQPAAALVTTPSLHPPPALPFYSLSPAYKVLSV